MRERQARFWTREKSWRARQQAALLALLVLCACLVCGCPAFEDCRLYNTCAGSRYLLKKATEMAGDGADDCEKCLLNDGGVSGVHAPCEQQEASCSQNARCSFVARCRLARGPVAYQDCLFRLYEAGYSDGTELRRPWEGGDEEEDQENEFADCLWQYCRKDCQGDKWVCDKPSREYRSLRIELAVRMYPGYRAVEHARVRACDNPNDEQCAAWNHAADGGWRETDEHGRVQLDELPPGITATRLYFELETVPGLEFEFPKTRYYPRRLGSSGLQLSAVYVVSSGAIALGNQLLGRPAEVLKDRAQSLILPDSCIWELNTVAGVRIFVDKVPSCDRPEACEVPRCYEDETSCVVPQCSQSQARCTGSSCPACVWYAKENLPVPYELMTDGTGAGIVGLDKGKYVVTVKDGDRVVSQREIYMEPGAMTIARTWPELK